MTGLSREAWYEEYMLMMDEEYGDYGFKDDPIILEELALEEEEESEPVKKYVIVSDDDEECNVPAEVIRLREIKVPEGVKKRKRDLRIEMLRRLEQAARTVIDFQNLHGWYDYLEDNEKSRVRKHEILRNGEDFPLEYGEDEDSRFSAGCLSNVIARQMRKGDILDFLYCKPDTIDQLVTTDYMIHFLRGIKKEERELFYYKVLDGLSNTEIAEMRGQTDRGIRKAWSELQFYLRQLAMGVLIYRSDKDFSFTGDEQRFLDTCREEYEFKLEESADGLS